jgi:hypothetical protein
MMGDHELPPEPLRGAILADLAPVRRLRAPARRALALLPLAALLVVAQPIVFGVRGDAAALGPILLWGLSLAQAALGFALLFAALRESVPGRALALSRALLASALAASLTVTFVTWSSSGTRVPSGRFVFLWQVCFVYPLLLGLPLVFVTLWLALRAYPLSPALVGGLVGLGVGLMTDSGWRTYCHVSEPRHVLSAHLAAMLALGAAGAFSAAVLWRRRR